VIGSTFGTAASGRPFRFPAAGYRTPMTDRENGVWRDEERLPLSELKQAMATWDTDGQGDASDNDTGQERESPDARPSTTGNTGPH
jgi:hypothetical protein